MRFLRLKMPRWPLAPADTASWVGLAAVTCGTWLNWGPGWAALVFGGLLLIDAYAERAGLGAKRS